MTEVLTVDPRDPDARSIARAADCLRRGGLVAFPTETVYGLGVHALDPAAVRALFEAKGRPADDPLIVHITAIDDLAALVAEVPPVARMLAAKFWPGPLTIVLRRSAAVPDAVTAGLETVAVRVPSHPVALALIDAARVPVAAPSANLFSRPSPTQAAHVLTDLGGRIDMVVDAGPTPVGLESTVLDLSQGRPVILRPGAVSLDMLRAVLPGVEARDPTSVEAGAQSSPGLLLKHYAPRAPLTVYAGTPGAALAALVRDARRLIDEGSRVAVLAYAEDIAGLAGLPAQLIHLGRESDPVDVATRLYRALRACDETDAEVVLCRFLTTPHALGPALEDRLRRAAAGRVVQG